MGYAEGTSVSVEKSKAEVERLLIRFGAEKYGSGWDENKAFIVFTFNGRMIRFDVVLPPKKDFERTPNYKYDRTPEQVEKCWEQACRETWRETVLLIKAKLVAVSKKSATFENEFLAYTCLPPECGGGTVGKWANQNLQKFIDAGKMPKLLMAGETDAR